MEDNEMDSLQSGLMSGINYNQFMSSYRSSIEASTSFVPFAVPDSPVMPQTPKPKTPKAPRCWSPLMLTPMPLKLTPKMLTPRAMISKSLRRATPKRLTPRVSAKPPMGKRSKRAGLRVRIAQDIPNVELYTQGPSEGDVNVPSKDSQSTKSQNCSPVTHSPMEFTMAASPVSQVQEPNTDSPARFQFQQLSLDSPATNDLCLLSQSPNVPSKRARTPMMGTKLLTNATNQKWDISMEEEDKENQAVHCYSPYGTDNLLHRRTHTPKRAFQAQQGKRGSPEGTPNKRRKTQKTPKISRKSTPNKPNPGIVDFPSFNMEKRTSPEGMEASSSGVSSGVGSWSSAYSTANDFTQSPNSLEFIPKKRILFPAGDVNAQTNSKATSQSPQHTPCSTKKRRSLLSQRENTVAGMDFSVFGSPNVIATPQSEKLKTPKTPSNKWVSPLTPKNLTPKTLTPSNKWGSPINPRHLACGTTPKRALPQSLKQKDDVKVPKAAPSQSPVPSSESSNCESSFLSTSENSSYYPYTRTKAKLHRKGCVGPVLGGITLKGRDGKSLGAVPEVSPREDIPKEVNLLDISNIKADSPVNLSPRQRSSTSNLITMNVNSTLNYPLHSTRNGTMNIDISAIKGIGSTMTEEEESASRCSTDSSEFSFDCDATLMSEAQPTRPQNPAVPTASLFNMEGLDLSTDSVFNPISHLSQSDASNTSKRSSNNSKGSLVRSDEAPAAHSHHKNSLQKTRQPNNGVDRDEEEADSTLVMEDLTFPRPITKDQFSLPRTPSLITHKDGFFNPQHVDLDVTQKVGCIGLLRRKKRKSLMKQKPTSENTQKVSGQQQTHSVPTPLKRKRSPISAPQSFVDEVSTPRKRVCTREAKDLEETLPQRGCTGVSMPSTPRFATLKKHKRTSSITKKLKQRFQEKTEEKVEEKTLSQQFNPALRGQYENSNENLYPRFAPENPHVRIHDEKSYENQYLRSASEKFINPHARIPLAPENSHENPRRISQVIRNNPGAVHYELDSELNVVPPVLPTDISDISTTSSSSNYSTHQRRKLKNKMKSFNQSKSSGRINQLAYL